MLAQFVEFWLVLFIQAELYQALIRVAMKKQDEVKKIILDTVSSESENILQSVVNLTLTGLSFSWAAVYRVISFHVFDRDVIQCSSLPNNNM